ncbi:MAG: FecR domain-containing protein [Myxococcaceae bacterium]|nr:FecR domain-containing protein [Myxococcaceae bacterium]
MKGPIEEHLAPPLSDGQLQSIARKVQAARHAADRSRWSNGRLASVVLLVLGVVVAATSWLSRPGPPAPLVTAAGTPLPSTIVGALAFSDGSSVSLEPGTHAEVVANQASKLTLLMRDGRGRFEVNPQSHRQWVIETGVASVEVLGTIFTVERRADGVRVAVERGVVLVRSQGLPDHLQRVEAGAEVFAPAATVGVSPPSAPVPLEPSPVVEPPVEPPAVEHRHFPVKAVASQRATSESSPVDAERPDWREPARRGDFVGAWALLGPRFAERLAAADKPALLLMADTARATARPAEAAAALGRVLERDPDDTVVAFTLGRLELEHLQRPAEAAAHFERVAAASPPSPLRYDALVRRVEALAAAADHSTALAVARDTIALFPAGAHTKKLEALVRALEPSHP